MYRFLDKRFYVRADWVFDLKEFAFENVGLSRNYAGNAGKIKGEAPARPGGAPRSRSSWSRSPARSGTRRRAATGRSGSPGAGAPPRSTRGRRRSSRTPRRPWWRTSSSGASPGRPPPSWRWQFAAEVVRAKLEIFDWLVGRKDRGVKLNPAGYLVDSIRKDYAAAQGLRVAGQIASDGSKATARARRKAAKATRRKAEDEKRTRADAESIEAYWQSLSPDQRDRLDAEAQAAADPAGLESCRSRPSLARVLPPEPPPRMDPRHPRRAVTRPAIATPSRRRRPASSAPKNSEMTWRWLIGPSSPPPFQSSFRRSIFAPQLATRHECVDCPRRRARSDEFSNENAGESAFLHERHIPGRRRRPESHPGPIAIFFLPSTCRPVL